MGAMSVSGLVDTLLIDIGNSRIKYCFSSNINAIFYLDEIDSLSKLSKKASSCLISNVGNELQLRQIVEILDANQVNVELIRTKEGVDNLKLCYQQPELLGVDRWLAMLAVKQYCTTNFAIIDLGTAMTCDVVNDNSEHIGGWIVPGFNTMIDALTLNTSLAHAKNRIINPHISFGTDTSSCISEGCRAQIAGFIFMTQQKMQQNFSQFKIFITGGDAKLINIEDFSHAEIKQNCVFEGMKSLI